VAEDIWRRPGVVFVDEVEEDESTQALQSQASVTISDPETGEPIGAITVGINLDML
jgi:phosphopantothenoylcysteine synthetase/decarboxylase